MYLVEVEHHVVAELAGAEQLSLLGDLEAVGHRNGVEHLGQEGKIEQIQQSIAFSTYPVKQVNSNHNARLNRAQGTKATRASGTL